MEFYQYPSRSLSSSSSSVISNVARVRERFNLTFSAILGSLISAIFTFCFAFVGILLGSLTGALIGQETESGFVRGAAIGAISGAVFSLEVFESSVVLWKSNESGVVCLLYLIDVIASLLSGRLVRERIGPAMLSAVQSQMGAVESTFEDVASIFDVGGSKGLSCDLVEKIPKIKITNNNNLDASGRKSLAQFAYRTSRLERRPEVCLTVTICFTFLASINGCLGTVLARCAEGTFLPPPPPLPRPPGLFEMASVLD